MKKQSTQILFQYQIYIHIVYMSLCILSFSFSFMYLITIDTRSYDLQLLVNEVQRNVIYTTIKMTA